MSNRWSSYTGLALLLTELTACGSSSSRKVAGHAGAGGIDQGGVSGDAGGAPIGGGGRSPVGGAGGSAPRGGAAGAGDTNGGGAANGGAGGDVAGSAGASGATDLGGSGGASGGASGSGAASGSAGSSAIVAHIDSFTGPASACAGSDVDLAFSYSGGSGVITPGAVAASEPAGHATVTFGAQDTTYTLTVTGTSGAPATATTMVTAVASPSSVVTTQATAAHGDTLVAASVPSQNQTTYAWAILSGNATINGSATKNVVAYDVGATGTEVVLQVVVTSASSACASTSTVHVPIRCGVPVLASVDRSKTPAVPQYVTSNEDTGHYDIAPNGSIWTSYLTAKSATASYDNSFDRFSAGTWNVPTSSPLALNDAAAHVLYSKVAVDNAGDAVFTWTQTSDNNNYAVMVSAYRVSDNKWSTPQVVGSVFNQSSPVDIQINRATGTALLVWAQGPYGSQIPHLRSYTVSTNALGADTALRAATTNQFTGDQMALDFATNDALTGFIGWFEQDSVSGLDSLYALHVTAGAPDLVGGVSDIKQLATATATYMTDVFNYNSVYAVSSDREPHLLAVAANGTGAVAWDVYNGLSTGANHGQLYVRRYMAGAWGAAELVATQVPSFAATDIAVDNAANVLVNTWTNNDYYEFISGAVGSAWSTPKQLASVTGYSALPHVAVDSLTGKGFATFRDPNAGARAPLRGVFYDPTNQSLSAPFTIDDPQQSNGESGRARIDGNGVATVLFTQMPKVLPGGANSSNSALLFVNTCK